MRQRTDRELVGELEAIATAAAERLRVLSEDDAERDPALRSRVGEAAGRAIAAGLSLASIAEAEAIGQGRAREELGKELLRRVQRAAARKREAEGEYEQAVVRACRVGLAQREVAAAAEIAHGTVRAIVARTSSVSTQLATRADGADSAQQSTDVPRSRHSSGSSRPCARA